jgi:DNA-binding HxlR family transcriptional regulator
MGTDTELPNSTEWSGIWEVLGCKWTFHILRLLARDDAQFNQIKSSIESLPASTLSTRLKSLQEEDVVVRSVDETATPPTVSYSLTAKGDELAEIITQIEELEQRYAHD